MVHYIQNDFLKIAVATKGAELQSVFNKIQQNELLWQANPEYWGKHSPVLFPIVGTLKNGMYRYEGKEYQLPRHGFARDLHFEVEEASDSQIILTLESSPQTLEVYPFVFKLQIIYSLKKHCLEVTYIVENVSAMNSMYFSLGAHPAFNVGARADDFNKFSLAFNNSDVLHATVLTEGLLTDEQIQFALSNRKLHLDYKLFEHDALVFLDQKSNEIQLVATDSTEIFNFKYKNFPFLGIWTVVNSGFICLEPWAGVADFNTHNLHLEQKVGIHHLAPKEQWVAQWSLSIPKT